MTCPAHRHGTVSAYRQGCRCGTAREAQRIYRKRMREGRHQPLLVDGTGTSRRLRALGAIGWPSTELGRRLDVSRITVQQWRAARRDIRRVTADRITRLYEELSGTAGPSDYTRSRARAFGWAPPLLWEGVNIDDPAAAPIDDTPVRPGSGKPRIDLHEVDHFTGYGLDLKRVAKVLGVRPDSIEQAQRRAAKRAADQATNQHQEAA